MAASPPSSGCLASGPVTRSTSPPCRAFLLVLSPVLVTIEKVAGAIYLIAHGIRSLLVRPCSYPWAPPERTDLRRALPQGNGVNLLNPGTALFALSILPPFVAPASDVAIQSLVPGGAAVAITARLQPRLWG